LSSSEEVEALNDLKEVEALNNLKIVEDNLASRDVQAQDKLMVPRVVQRVTAAPNDRLMVPDVRDSLAVQSSKASDTLFEHQMVLLAMAFD